MPPLSTLEKTFRRVQSCWLTSRQIWELVDEGSLSTVRRALVRLWQSGRIERHDTPMKNGARQATYRRKVMVG